MIFLLQLFLMGCSGFEQTEKNKLKSQNAVGEYVWRQKNEYHYAVPTPKPQSRAPYPWEGEKKAGYLTITKDFFRCRGSEQNPPILHEGKYRFDCGGPEKHSLPLKEGREFIYPILIELLNYIQEKMVSKVVITCGHRCPVHNTYSDHSLEAKASKHMLGAEVDFFVEGLQWRSENVVEVIENFFKTHPRYRNEPEYQYFRRQSCELTTPAWANREILVKLHKPFEGRDGDNQHPYPYLTIQVQFDRSCRKPITFSWSEAFNSYLRY